MSIPRAVKPRIFLRGDQWVCSAMTAKGVAEFSRDTFSGALRFARKLCELWKWRNRVVE